jgi:hypothetical protein
MKTGLYKHAVIVCLFFSNLVVFAQQKIDSNTVKKSYWEVSANYLSNAVYSGRKDSAIVAYLRPSIGYHHKSGVYIKAGLAYLSSAGSDNKINMFSIDGGYDFSIGEHLDAGLYASQYFYSDASYAVLSELNGSAGFYAGYNLGAVNINAGADFLFSQSTDFTGNLGLNHEFNWTKKKTIWSLYPAVVLNAGTQYFYESYYKYRKFVVANGNGNSKGRGHSQTTTANNGYSSSVSSLTVSYNNRFTVLDYELSLPFKYEQKKWSFYITPTYAMPVSPISYNTGQTIETESLSNSFFVEIGATLKLLKHLYHVTGVANPYHK